MIKKHIPNSITCCNLISGCIATYFALKHDFNWALTWIILGAVFNFFDGMTARLLHVSSPLARNSTPWPTTSRLDWHPRPWFLPNYACCPTLPRWSLCATIYPLQPSSWPPFRGSDWPSSTSTSVRPWALSACPRLQTHCFGAHCLPEAHRDILKTPPSLHPYCSSVCS